MFRDGLKLFLSSQADFAMAGETGELGDLLGKVRACRPDLLLIDYHMPGGDTGALISHLKQTDAEMRIVVLTGSHSGLVLRQLIKSAADAVLSKDESAEELLSHLRAVVLGQKLVSARIKALIGDDDTALSRREMQVLKLVCDGLTGPAVAEVLSLSPKTVDKHRENIMRKLEVNSTVQLMQKVHARGWFSH